MPNPNKSGPGPGNYNIPLSTFIKIKNGGSFGKAARKLNPTSEKFGADFLPQESSFKSKAKNAFSFGKSKYSRSLVNKNQIKNPGPGHYNSEKLMFMKKTPAGIFGSAKRVISEVKDDTPGVGKYNPEKFWYKNNRKGFSVGRCKRFKSTRVRLIRMKILVPDRKLTRQMS